MIKTIERMTVEPDDTDLVRYDQFIKKIKIGQGLPRYRENLNRLFDGLWIRSSHDAQAGLLNWVKNDHDSIANNSPLFTAYEGYRTSPTNSYIDLNFSPNNGVAFGSESGYHISAWNLEKVGTNNTYLMSAREGSYESYIFPSIQRINSAGQGVGTTNLGYLNDFFCRRRMGQYEGWINGILEGSNTSSAGIDLSTNYSLFENARNDSGVTNVRQNGLVAISSVGAFLPNPFNFYLAKKWFLEQLNLL